MDHIKGFSLIEVLLSLMLTTTIALFLLQLHGMAHVWLNQFIQYSQAASLLDHADERIVLGAKQRFKPVDPYLLYLEQNTEHKKLDVFSKSGTLILSRTYPLPQRVPT